MDRMLFAKNLKELRAGNMETQNVLAGLLYVERTAISHWERGTRYPDPETLSRIAEHYGISKEDLTTKCIERKNILGGGVKIMEIGTTKENGKNYEIIPMENGYYEYVGLIRLGNIKNSPVEKYQEALKIDYELDQNMSEEKLINMVHLYWDAFDSGVIEAGVNTLKILIITCEKSKSMGKGIVFEDRITSVISELIYQGDPAGDYYDALCTHIGLFNEDEDMYEKLFDQGLIRMAELAEAGNVYAEEFMNKLGLMEE